jgi:hypothetical protein
MRQSGECYVLIFDRQEAHHRKILGGIFALDGAHNKIGCIEATDGNTTEEFYFTGEGLQTYLRYSGREPTWLERNKLGVTPEPIANVTRIQYGAHSELWYECCRVFSSLQTRVTNMGEPQR